MSKLEVDKIDPQSGTDLELGSSGDTITIPTGVTLDASNATTTLPANVVTTDGTQTLTNKTIDASQLSGTITPSDGTVTNAKVNASAAIDYSKLNLTGNIALADLSATGTKDATTFLRGDNTFAEAGGGITMADQWRLTANVTLTDPSAFVTSNWERNDNSGYGGIGTGMTESSGVFSFPSTGIYLIQAYGSFQQTSGAGNNNALFIYSTIDNSSYTHQTGNLSFGEASPDHNAASSSFLFDVTDVSNCKVKFEQLGDNGILRGASTQNRTHITFIRLGDT
jgi:hypothetical protein